MPPKPPPPQQGPVLSSTFPVNFRIIAIRCKPSTENKGYIVIRVQTESKEITTGAKEKLLIITETPGIFQVIKVKTELQLDHR